MAISCLKDLLNIGWSKNGEKGYLRPDKKVVARKRDLSIAERIEFGHILFPPRTSKPLTPAGEVTPVGPSDTATGSDTQGTSGLIRDAVTYQGNDMEKVYILYDF